MKKTSDNQLLNLINGNYTDATPVNTVKDEMWERGTLRRLLRLEDRRNGSLTSIPESELIMYSCIYDDPELYDGTYEQELRMQGYSEEEIFRTVETERKNHFARLKRLIAFAGPHFVANELDSLAVNGIKALWKGGGQVVTSDAVQYNLMLRADEIRKSSQLSSILGNLRYWMISSFPRSYSYLRGKFKRPDRLDLGE